MSGAVPGGLRTGRLGGCGPLANIGRQSRRCRRLHRRASPETLCDASDFGIWNTNCGAVIRRQHAIHGENVRLLFNIVPEAAAYMAERDVVDVARSTVFNTQPDALCVSGLTAGAETSSEALKRVKDAVPDTPVFANTGVRLSNVEQQLSIADGAVTGTTFKRDGYIWNEVDVARVREFMDKVKEIRKSAAAS